MAAAVVLGGDEISGINDSKLLRPALRQEIFGALLRRAEAVPVVAYPAWWIDRHGVGLANREALRRASPHLSLGPGAVLLTATWRSAPRWSACPGPTPGARRSQLRVLAKVLRDDAMRALSETHTGYGFGRNRGYGTPEHRLALSELGPCRVHRFSYAGVGD